MLAGHAYENTCLRLIAIAKNLANQLGPQKTQMKAKEIQLSTLKVEIAESTVSRTCCGGD